MVFPQSRRRTRRSPAAVRHDQIERLEPRWNLSGPSAEWQVMIDNGSHENRVDIVFLGDGYTESEIDTVYAANIEAMLRHMFDEGEDPFPRYRNFFNISRIDVISAQSGVDQPGEGIFRNTALDATYQFDGTTDRLAYITQHKADAYVNDLPFSAEMKFVALNSSKYGGGGGSYAVYAGNNSSSPEVALHEVGHSFAHLADEYDYGGSTTYTGSEPTEPNVTTSSTGEKWSEWLGYFQPGIGMIGAYEGGLYSDFGIYRPSESSKMRSLDQPFDAISREAFIRRIYEIIDPIDAALESNAPLSTSATLWADVIDPLVIQMQWSVDGQPISGATGPYFVPADYGFNSGSHTVTLDAWDNTDWVRRGTSDLHDQREWTVTAGGTTPGLAFSSSAAQLVLTEGGNSLQYQMRLSAPPTQPVTISLNSNGELNVSPEFLEFTAANWDELRTVTVSARTDDVIDGDDVGRIVYDLESLDAAYNQLAVPQTRATVHDATSPVPLNHAPVTSPQSFQVQSTWINGTFVGTLAASDQDSGQALTWAIVSGNESGIWALDAATGQITLADASQLDPQSQPILTLLVTVFDSGSPSLSADTAVAFQILEPSSDAEVRLNLQVDYLEYQTRGSQLILDAAATVQTFGGTGDLDEMLLTIRSTGKRAGKDRITIVPGGAASSMIATNGSQVTFDGIQIGTILATRPKDGLQISFNSAASTLSVQALIRRIAFQTTAKKRALRHLDVQLENYQGVNSEPFQVLVQPLV